MKTYLPYKEPTIVRARNDWFVKYFYEIPGQSGVFKEFRVRDGVNYIKDPIEKEQYIQQLCADVTLALKEQMYNPFGEHLSVGKEIAVKTKELAEKKQNPQPGHWSRPLISTFNFLQNKVLQTVLSSSIIVT